MKFHKRLFNRVESDQGFIVKIRAFEGFVEYREGKRIATVPVEPVIGQPLVHVYKNTPIKWNPPNSDDLISDDKRDEILENIVGAMRFRRYNVDLV